MKENQISITETGWFQKILAYARRHGAINAREIIDKIPLNFFDKEKPEWQELYDLLSDKYDHEEESDEYLRAHIAGDILRHFVESIDQKTFDNNFPVSGYLDISAGNLFNIFFEELRKLRERKMDLKPLEAWFTDENNFPQKRSIDE